MKLETNADWGGFLNQGLTVKNNISFTFTLNVLYAIYLCKTEL